MSAPRPPLSVVIPVRNGPSDVAPVIATMLAQAERTGTEIVLVGRPGGAVPPGVRFVSHDTDDLYALRAAGVRAARGAVVAIGEDHAVPRSDWCEAVIRAHAEHPEPVLAGCLVNATGRTLSGRVNFLAFAAAYEPPMPRLPPLRPPPISALSLKREALAELDGTPGQLETVLIPRLFARGAMAADERAVVYHHQDHGVPGAVLNAFDSARASYGYGNRHLPGRRRLRVARWSLRNWPRRTRVESAAGAGRKLAPAERAAIAAIGLAVGVGAAVGTLAGPGRSPERVA